MSEGIKFDAGKVRMSLMPKCVLDALLSAAKENQRLKYPTLDTRYEILVEISHDLSDQDYPEALAVCLRLMCPAPDGPLGGILGILQVLEFGAKKYGFENWQLVENAKERYTNAAWRHIIEMCEGTETDPETGLPHAAHLGCNLVFLTWLKAEGKT